MKRSGEIRRKAWMPRGTKPLPKVNAAQKKRKSARYRLGMARARHGAGYKSAKARAGGRCENLRLFPVIGERRCESRDRLQGHHLTYTRFGGEEWAEDYVFVCKECHAMLEREARPWNQGRHYA